MIHPALLTILFQITDCLSTWGVINMVEGKEVNPIYGSDPDLTLVLILKILVLLALIETMPQEKKVIYRIFILVGLSTTIWNFGSIIAVRII